MKKNISTLIMIIILVIIYNTDIINISSNNIKYVTPTNETIDSKDIIPIVDINNYISKYNNNDIVAYLNIYNTNIKTPVAKYNDNDYYLKHDLNKKNNPIGSIFMDYRVNPNDRKVLIYGHNSKINTTIFKELENYYDENYYNNHQIIELTSQNSVNRYQIFSVFVEPSDWTYMNINFNDDTWLEHLNMLKNKSWYPQDIELSSTDEIIIIQTCSYHENFNAYKDKYLLLIGKKIDSKLF